MTPEDLRDEIASLYAELPQAQLSGDDQWLKDVQDAIQAATKELEETEALG